MKAQDFLTAFNSLIKNRLGPYKISLKDDYGYISSPCHRNDKEHAFDYTSYAPNSKCLIFFDNLHYYPNCKPFLISAAKNDIPLTKQDFKAGSYEQ